MSSTYIYHGIFHKCIFEFFKTTTVKIADKILNYFYTDINNYYVCNNKIIKLVKIYKPKHYITIKLSKNNATLKLYLNNLVNLAYILSF